VGAHDIEAVIPATQLSSGPAPFRSPSVQEPQLGRALFCRIKQFRRIATRYDKLAERFASFVALTAAVIWLA
jgi:transposase